MRKTLNTASLLALTLGLTGGLSAAFVTTAQAADAAEAGASTDTTEEVIVTGTRLTGLTVADSPAPIQVLALEPSVRVNNLARMQSWQLQFSTVLRNRNPLFLDSPCWCSPWPAWYQWE